jgi:ribonuclease D
MLPTGPPDPIWIETQPALAAMVMELEQCPIVAVDTESNSLYAYREQVCLIQFSTPTVDYLVDPLTLADLSPLAPIFCNPAIEKVFHAAEYDIICLRRDFGFDFIHLFDTMIAGRILGRQEIGLAAMLEAEFGVTLDKHFQRANWGQRPLSPAMLAYARLDTHYLLGLRERLRTELQERQRWALAQEDFCRVSLSNGHAAENGNEHFWRINGAQDLEPRKASVLRELCLYRDMQAQSINQPPFKVLGNHALLEIAQTLPRYIQELDLLPSMSPRQVRRHAKGLLGAVQRGLASPPPRRPHCKRLDDPTMKRTEKLHAWRKRVAKTLEVESDIVLPRDVLNAIAESNPATLVALAAAMTSVPWRFERFGADLLHTLHSN